MELYKCPLAKISQLSIKSNKENKQSKCNEQSDLSQPGPKHVTHFLKNVFDHIEADSKEGF